MDTEILWKYYQEDLKQAFNHESSRFKITNLIMAVSGALLSIIGYNNGLDNDDLALTIPLIALGIFGMIFNAKYYERFNFHYERSRKYRKLLEEQYSDIPFSDFRYQADYKTKNKYKLSSRIRLNWLWIVLNFLISNLGLILTYLIIY